MAINLKIDDSELKKAVSKLNNVPKEIPKATASAINRTLTFTRKRVNQEVRKTYNIKSAEVTKTLEIHKANASNLTASIISKGNRLTLGRFGRNTGNWTNGKPVKVKVKKSGVKTVNTSPKSFVTALTGNSHIVKRVSNKSYPIKVLHTLSVPQMISNQNISEKVQGEAGQKLQERINHEVEYRLSKYSK
ncbi:hypothetical protein DVV81_08210 [Clostridium botulinum]|uniref:phage tail protein n=1 Tax=Clostridium botulinum TaxID=1491 RepID=UPI00196780FA|nr:phage tail protein [Clostridium botulinum]MBN1071152.1 hypothetical protein [Clostridium botulinum]